MCILSLGHIYLIYSWEFIVSSEFVIPVFELIFLFYGV